MVVILILIFTIFTIYFLGISIYVYTKLYQIKNEQARVDKEAVAISNEMTSNNQLLQNFILSKFILTKIQSLNKEKFPYSEYLDQISGLLPPEAALKNVDFSKKGWVSVLVSVPGGSPQKQLELNLTNASLINATGFSSIFSTSFDKDTSGIYNAKLEFETKNNAGK